MIFMLVASLLAPLLISHLIGSPIQGYETFTTSMLSGLITPQQLRHFNIGNMITTPDVVRIRTVNAVKQLRRA